jgi:hypothetical protein
MKQLLPLFLFLLPCLAWAQYPSNGNQKITLGEQTTADGLIYRGVAATDTVRKPSIDTMAYMVLDTTTNIMWHYKKATSNAWLRLNLLPSDTASMLTPYWRAGRFSGTLPVANGGTNASTFTSGSIVFAGSGGTYSQNSNLFWDNTNSRLGIGITNPEAKIHIKSDVNGTSNMIFENLQGGPNSSAAIYLKTRNVAGNADVTGIITKTKTGGYYFDNNENSTNAFMQFSNYLTTWMYADGNGKVGIGTTTPQSGYRLHVVDSVYVGGNVSASAYTTRSDYNLKDDIFDLKYGLNDVLQLQPVEYTYKSNGSKQLGFIAQDIGTILPEVVSFEESMSVNYQAIIPILTKAIQEQQALIKALEQRIINLENK